MVDSQLYARDIMELKLSHILIDYYLTPYMLDEMRTIENCPYKYMGRLDNHRSQTRQSQIESFVFDIIRQLYRITFNPFVTEASNRLEKSTLWRSLGILWVKRPFALRNSRH